MSMPINSLGATRTLATPKVTKTFVNQPVHLRPQGNTIALSVPAEMPFLTRGVTVVTQASGGMAKPDPKMQSKYLRSGGQAGLGGELEDKAYSLFNQYDSEAASMDRSTYDANTAKRSYWEGEAKKQMPAAGPSAWSKAGDIFATTASTGLNVFSQINQAKIAAANAAAAQAQADIAKSGSYSAALMASLKNPTAAMAQRKGITIPLLIIGGGALAVALFLFLRKKSAGSTPAAA